MESSKREFVIKDLMVSDFIVQEGRKILLEETEENLHILVKNNGSLFEDNLLQKLYSHQIQSRGSGIGLININERIKLMFGSDYGLQLYNEDDKAVAQIDIPYLVI